VSAFSAADTEVEKPMDNTEQLVREYEQLTAQIIHWDNLSWQTSQFFSAIEGAFLAGIGRLIYGEFEKQGASNLALVLLLIGGAVFNIVLCVFWFRINRRNREFLDIRFTRAREIEAQPNIAARIYTYQREELTKPKYRGHGTSNLERRIPILFLTMWILIILGSAALLFY